MQEIKAVLFDFGMVLSGPPSVSAWAEMRQVSGLDEQTLQREYWAHRDDYDRGTVGSVDYWHRVAAGAQVSFSEQTIAKLTALDVALWTEMNEPMVAWVQALHRAGVRTGILSNIGDAMAQGICEKFDWIGDFHHAVWSHALKMRKPEPAIYLAAAEGLGVPVEQILFIDDRAENIEAAEKFGMQGVVYAGHDAFTEQMRTRGYGHLLQPVAAATAAQV